ncbi:MAG: hypothetical protein JW944_02770 [Deltaproteobacteria bacterium]|nr:hypothetical protein [Deltaproteobacteria bacterium]
MDSIEKAKIRITSWMHHNEHHQEEYELFADQLEKDGQAASAHHISEMAALAAKTNECLKKALLALEKRKKA